MKTDFRQPDYGPSQFSLNLDFNPALTGSLGDLLSMVIMSPVRIAAATLLSVWSGLRRSGESILDSRSLEHGGNGLVKQ